MNRISLSKILLTSVQLSLKNIGKDLLSSERLAPDPSTAADSLAVTRDCPDYGLVENSPLLA